MLFRQLIDNLEHAIGFSPSFNSINQALSVIESFLPMKQQGLGMTKQWQLTKIFKTLDSALKVPNRRSRLLSTRAAVD